MLRDLDKSLQGIFYRSCFQQIYMKFNKLMHASAGIQRQNEQHCLQEIEEFKEGIKSGNIAPGTSLTKFSDEAQDEQKHAIRIADEKVALAVQAYDLVHLRICFVVFVLEFCVMFFKRMKSGVCCEVVCLFEE